jgi:hypothetical protein
MQLAVSTSPNHTMLRRRKNAWYSIKDGNWEDPNVWMSNALDKKNHTMPQTGDDVYISHAIDYYNNLSGSLYQYNNTIGNLFIHNSGKLTSTRGGNQNKLIVNGNLYGDGTIDYSAPTTGISLWLNNTINYCNNFIPGTGSTVVYNSPFDCVVMPVTYYNLEIANTGTKTVNSSLNCINTFQLDSSISTLELAIYDANFKHIQAFAGGKLSKSGAGTINITGLITSNGIFSFTGNPTVNMNGAGIASSDTRNGWNFGSTINITTSQTWAFNSSGNLPSTLGNGSFLVGSGVTLTVGTVGGVGSNIGGWLNKGTISGMDGTSTLLIDGTYGFGNTNIVMAIGTVNYNHSGTSRIYVSSGIAITVPTTSFYDLETAGTCTLSGNTIISHNLNIDAGTLELAGFNFTVSGITTLGGTLNNTGDGTTNLSTTTFTGGKINFVGSPTVNMSGNFSGDARGGVNFGSNPLNITQSITFALTGSGNVPPVMSVSILIASGKTLTNAGISASIGGLNITGTIKGADATAIFDNRGLFTYQNAAAPMATGKLYCNQSANTFIYGLAGNQDITVPSDTTPGYQNLTLNNSGAKRLLGNISVKSVYTLTPLATLNTNGFALTNP